MGEEKRWKGDRHRSKTWSESSVICLECRHKSTERQSSRFFFSSRLECIKGLFLWHEMHRENREKKTRCVKRRDDFSLLFRKRIWSWIRNKKRNSEDREESIMKETRDREVRGNPFQLNWTKERHKRLSFRHFFSLSFLLYLLTHRFSYFLEITLLLTDHLALEQFIIQSDCFSFFFLENNLKTTYFFFFFSDLFSRMWSRPWMVSKTWWV